MTERAVCDVCGSADVLGIGTCVPCGSGASEALLFLQRSVRRADRRAIETWLVDSTGGGIGRDDAREAAEGLRPIVVLPEFVAGRASGRLSVRGLNATTVSTADAWRQIPRGLRLLSAAIIGVGLYLGLALSAWFLGLSALFVGLVATAAIKRLRAPVWEPDGANVLGLPDPAESRVRATLNELPESRARQYLTDLAVLSTGLLTTPEGSPSPDVDGAVTELLALASDAAVDLHHLDTSLRVLERSDEASPLDVENTEALARASSARVMLVRKFDEAVAALARLQAAAVEAPTRLAELTEALAEDAERRAEAWEAVERLTA
jgi:hypothetical protein